MKIDININDLKLVIFNNKLVNYLYINSSKVWNKSESSLSSSDTPALDNQLNNSLLESQDSDDQSSVNYDFVDLGLSVKWSTKNLGASDITDNGMHIYWGDGVGNATLYTNSTLTDIKNTELDIVHNTLGGKWRLPTIYEIFELLNICTRQAATINEKYCTKFTSPDGTSITFPKNGYYKDGVYNKENSCFYWSSNKANEYESYGVYFTDHLKLYDVVSTVKFGVRPVYDESSDKEQLHILDGDILYSKDRTLLIKCFPLKQGSFSIPNSVTTLGSSAFEDCEKLTSITIPDSVTTIGLFAFYQCIGLLNITIPNSVTTLESSAFNRCNKLQAINIPASVNNIDIYSLETAWNGVNNLNSITVDPANTTYSSENSNIVMNKSTQTIIAGCNTSVIPNSALHIGDAAFKGCQLNNTLDLSSILTIGDYAFEWCRGLNTLELSTNISKLSMGVFSYSDLDTLIVSNQLTTVESSAFKDSTIKTLGLNSTLEEGIIKIPNSVTFIGSGAFDGCHYIIEVILPNTITSIESMTFSCCRKLEKVYIPNTVTTIKSCAFLMGAIRDSSARLDIIYDGTKALWDLIELEQEPNAWANNGFNIYLTCNDLEEPYKLK